MKVALTGGIACGKSLVAKFLNELGIETIDADDVAHELIPDPAERKRIAAEVFGNEAKRKELEARIHPRVKDEINKRITESLNHRNESGDSHDSVIRLFGDSVIVIIPLLFEAHWDADYDIICCVRSERELQVSRMMTTRGYTREEAEARLAAQMPVEEKAAQSHYVIDNNGSSEDLRQKVQQFVVWLNQTIKQS